MFSLPVTKAALPNAVFLYPPTKEANAPVFSRPVTKAAVPIAVLR
jgi:hypothetical protein